MLQDRLGLSERRACRIAGQHRSTQRHRPQVAKDDGALRAQLRKISQDKPCWGYRRAQARLIEESWSLNRKRVQRLWREEGLRVPAHKRKRRRLGENSDGKQLRAKRPNHVWALDLQADETAAGRQLRLLNVVDEFTREALAGECERSITAEDTVATLDCLIAARGTSMTLLRTPSVGFYVAIVLLALLVPQVAAFGYLLIAVVGVFRQRGERTPASAPS